MQESYCSRNCFDPTTIFFPLFSNCNSFNWFHTDIYWQGLQIKSFLKDAREAYPKASFKKSHTQLPFKTYIICFQGRPQDFGLGGQIFCAKCKKKIRAKREKIFDYCTPQNLFCPPKNSLLPL